MDTMSDDSTDDMETQKRKFITDNSIEMMLHPATNAYLDQLAATNLYGMTRVTVAIALIDEGIRNAITNGFIEISPKGK